MLASGDAYKLLRDGYLEVPRKFRNALRASLFKLPSCSG